MLLMLECVVDRIEYVVPFKLLLYGIHSLKKKLQAICSALGSKHFCKTLDMQLYVRICMT